MIRILLRLLTLGFSVAPVLCWAAEPNPGRQKAVAGEQSLNWKDFRALDVAWRQQYQADLNLARNAPSKTWTTEGKSFAFTIERDVPYEYQYALMLELTRSNAKLDASPELLRVAPEGFAELFGKRHDRSAGYAAVTAVSRNGPEYTTGRVDRNRSF